MTNEETLLGVYFNSRKWIVPLSSLDIYSAHAFKNQELGGRKDKPQVSSEANINNKAEYYTCY